jgi:YgiT-type zinc finger domain-containing protein
MPEQARSTCPRCQIGLMRATQLPYTVIENGKLVSVPEMAARVCDVCGNRDFDRESVKRLYLMLGAARRRRRDSSSADRTPAAPTGERAARRSSRTSRPKKT